MRVRERIESIGRYGSLKIIPSPTPMAIPASGLISPIKSETGCGRCWAQSNCRLSEVKQFAQLLSIFNRSELDRPFT